MEQLIPVLRLPYLGSAGCLQLPRRPGARPAPGSNSCHRRRLTLAPPCPLPSSEGNQSCPPLQGVSTRSGCWSGCGGAAHVPPEARSACPLPQGLTGPHEGDGASAWSGCPAAGQRHWLCGRRVWGVSSCTGRLPWPEGTVPPASPGAPEVTPRQWSGWLWGAPLPHGGSGRREPGPRPT